MRRAAELVGLIVLGLIGWVGLMYFGVNLLAWLLCRIAGHCCP